MQELCVYCREEDSLDNLRRVCQNCVVYIHEKCAATHVTIGKLKRIKCFICNNKPETCPLRDLISTHSDNIFQCIRENDLEGVRKCLEKCVTANMVTYECRTPLHDACYHNYSEIVRLLLRNYANVDADDVNDNRPLHYACLQGHLESAKLLIEKHAVIHYKNRAGQTPLYCACEAGCPELVKLLIDKGDDLRTNIYNGNSPLHAISYTHFRGTLRNVEPMIEIAKLLIKNYANIDARNNQKNSALHIACEQGNLEIVKLLVENRADTRLIINIYGQTPLKLAKDSNRTDVVTYLQSL